MAIVRSKNGVQEGQLPHRPTMIATQGGPCKHWPALLIWLKLSVFARILSFVQLCNDPRFNILPAVKCANKWVRPDASTNADIKSRFLRLTLPYLDSIMLVHHVGCFAWDDVGEQHQCMPSMAFWHSLSQLQGSFYFGLAAAAGPL
eukprot:2374509-Pleurochrysis_carterae.AAC.1